MIRQRFERTVCDCNQCRELCRACPGMLASGDAGLLSDHLDEPVEPYLSASPGAIVAARKGDGLIELRRIPTIVPSIKDGACVFFSSGECRVHPVSPFGCAFYDVHMPAAEADRRTFQLLSEIQRDSVYNELWRSLWESGRRSKGPEEKRRTLIGG